MMKLNKATIGLLCMCLCLMATACSKEENEEMRDLSANISSSDDKAFWHTVSQYKAKWIIDNEVVDTTTLFIQLLNAIHSGERRAMRRLYDRYSGFAMAVALRYVPNHEDAHDVLQDSFVKILTSLDGFTYRGEGSLKAWVSAIVMHQALDFVKRHERLVLTEHIPDEAVEEPELGCISPEVLTRLIGLLPPGYRMVLNLYVFEQLSHKEIASLLGIKPETSASQYLRAKNALAKLINEYLKTTE